MYDLIYAHPNNQRSNARKWQEKKKHYMAIKNNREPKATIPENCSPKAKCTRLLGQHSFFSKTGQKVTDSSASSAFLLSLSCWFLLRPSFACFLSFAQKCVHLCSLPNFFFSLPQPCFLSQRPRIYLTHPPKRIPHSLYLTAL